MNESGGMVPADIAVAAGIFLGSVTLLAVCWAYARHRQLGAAGGGLAAIGAILLITSILATAKDPGIDELSARVAQLEGTHRQTAANVGALREELQTLGTSIAELGARLDETPETHRRLATDLRQEINEGLDGIRSNMEQLQTDMEQCRKSRRCPVPK